jgi:hypothetical protein
MLCGMTTAELSPSAVFLIRTEVEGVGKQLEPDVNSFQEVTNDLLPVLARRGMLTDETMARMAEAALAQVQG